MFDNCDDVIEIVKIIGEKKSKQLLPTRNRMFMNSDSINNTQALINPPVELEQLELWIAKRASVVNILIPELNNMILQYAGITYITYENIINYIKINRLIVPYETKVRQIELKIRNSEQEIKNNIGLKKQLTADLYKQLQLIKR